MRANEITLPFSVLSKTWHRSQPTRFLVLQITTIFIIHTSKDIILLKLLQVCLFFTKGKKILFLTHIHRHMNQFSSLKFAVYISYHTVSLRQVEGVGTRNQSRGALLRWLTIHPQHSAKEIALTQYPLSGATHCNSHAQHRVNNTENIPFAPINAERS